MSVNNGTSTPSHIPPEGDAKAAASKMMSSLFGPNAAPVTPEVAAQVQLTEEEKRQREETRSQIAARLTAKLNPNAPQEVQPAEPVVISAPDKVEVPAVSQVEPAPSTEIEGLQLSEDAEKNPKAEDFRAVRTELKKHKTTAAELLTQKTSLEEKLQKYESGEVLTPIAKELQDKVNKLQPFEHLVNLRTSDAYGEKVNKLNDNSSRLKEIGKDYNVPDSVMDKAMSITNRRDRNEFLLSHFDEVGALEVKGILEDSQKLHQEIRAAEAEPEKALQRMTQERLQLRAQEENRRVSQISDTSKNSWANSLLGIRSQGKITEIIPRENDPEFNTTWVEPITQKASQEYGKFVTYFGQNGLKQLDPDVAQGLATTTILATVASTAIERANALEAELAELRANSRVMTPMLRPGVTSRGGATPQPAQARPSSPQGAAKSLLQSVGVKY